MAPEGEPRQHRILCNIASNHWAAHFIDSDGQTRIGPWLLFDSFEEVEEKVLRWGHVTEEGTSRVRYDLERWGATSVAMHLTDAKRAALIERGRGWPWDGYTLIRMKAAGKYPPERLTGKRLKG